MKKVAIIFLAYLVILKDLIKKVSKNHKVLVKVISAFFIATITVSGYCAYANESKYSLDNFKEVEIVIGVNGDNSAWEAQEKLTPNMDINKLIYMSEQLNHKKLSTLQKGEKIYLLQKK
ncbi:hypothetical protein BFS06_11865 [Clostridium perfringens]|uniref:Uncharacterized protein n=1 Tax=Clostridium perfringens TaxID=1502 RepID=A0A140GS75_CLOPF|nr:hypothetical protein [Clostridium perfringens]AMN31384.1 hypothetical protein JFP838_pA0468 [Clostridium perfringens]TBX14899.1 hypothetical protein BFS06_11865 [Clostridium perfringens]